MRELAKLTWQDWRQLLRLRLTLMVSASAATGYLLFPAAPDPLRGLAVVAAVACLCCGGTVLNQIQERDLDACMLRTAQRPLAGSRLSPAAALLLASALSLSGFSSLWLLEPVSVWLGLFALLWYNAIYTPLKRRTSLAVLLGALCGAVPPLIGWKVAGGSLTDPVIVLVSGLLVLWQIPHFLLLAGRYRDDYRRAGLPVFGATVEVHALRRVLSLWLAAVSVSFLLLPAFGVLRGAMFQGLALLLAVALAVATWWLGRQEQWSRLFTQLNLHMGLLLMLLVGQRLVAGIF